MTHHATEYSIPTSLRRRLRLYGLRATLALLLLLLPAVCRSADTTDPATKRAIEKIYSYSFFDMNRALHTLNRLRSEKRIDTHRADKIEGDLFLNQGNFFEALKFYKRVLYSDEAARDPKLQMKIIRMVLLCYDSTHNLQKMDYYQRKLEQMARQANDTAMRAVALFNKGKMEHYMGRKANGCQLIRKAAQTMEHSGMKSRINETYYYRITLIELLQQDGAYHTARAELDRLARFINTNMKRADFDPSIVRSVERDLDAHRAVVYSKLGMRAEAARSYADFMRASDVMEFDFKCIMPYLTDNHLYDDIISLSAQRFENLRKSGYDASADLCYVFKSMGDAYMHKANYREAAEAYLRLDSIRQRQQTAEEQSAIDELTTNYETNREKLEMERSMARLKIEWIVGTAMAAMLVLAFIAWRERRNARVIARKNQWMAHYIDMSRKREEHPTPTADPEEAPATEEDSEERLFERLRQTIIDERLYLDRDLSREVLLEKAKVPKNKFAKLFRTYANTTYSKFINDLRLDYAVGMLKQHTNYTIDAISAECGFTSASTFYTLFAQRFGMTPSEYKKAISKDQYNTSPEA